MTTIHYNPFAMGIRILTGIDPRPEGFEIKELRRVHYELTADDDGESLILEAADFAELDRVYSPGEIVPAETFVLEAVTAKYGRIAQRMAAIGRVVGKSLGEGIEISGTSEGKVKKQMGFATVMGSLNLSDGQTASVVFHAPEGDRKKVAKGETMVAFRFLLNNADITHVVAPRNMQEMTLETVGKRIGQLATENSAKFQAAKAKREAKAAELKAAQEAAAAAGAEADDLNARVGELTSDSAELDTRIVQAEDRLAKLREENADLEAKLADMRAKSAGGDGKEERAGGGDGSEEADPVTAFVEGTMRPELEGRGFVLDPEIGPDKRYAFSISGKKAKGKGKGTPRAILVTLWGNPNRFEVRFMDAGGTLPFSIDSKDFESKTPRGLPGAFKKALAFADKYLKLMEKDDPAPVGGGDEGGKKTDADGRTVVGTNEEGNTVYEDENGNRYVLTKSGESTFRESAPVVVTPYGPEMRSTRELFDRYQTKYLTAEELEAFRQEDAGADPFTAKLAEALKPYGFEDFGRGLYSVDFGNTRISVSNAPGEMFAVLTFNAKGALLDRQVFKPELDNLDNILDYIEDRIAEAKGGGPPPIEKPGGDVSGEFQAMLDTFLSDPELENRLFSVSNMHHPGPEMDKLLRAIAKNYFDQNYEDQMGAYIQSRPITEWPKIEKDWKERAFKTIKERTLAMQSETPPDEGTDDTGPDATETPAAVQTLQDIIDGKYDGDSEELEAKLDEAAEELEAAGKDAEYDALLNQAADKLTEALEKEAA